MELSNIEESASIFDTLTRARVCVCVHFARRVLFEIRVRSNREQFCSSASVSHYLGRATIRSRKRDIYGRGIKYCAVKHSRYVASGAV